MKEGRKAERGKERRKEEKEGEDGRREEDEKWDSQKERKMEVNERYQYLSN